MQQALDVEIQRNYAAFVDLLETLLPENRGKFALLHRQELEGVFDTPGQAARTGFAKFGNLPYSIQLVTDEPIDLGFMSNALRPGANPR
jgi:hypothetical protein